MESLSSPDQLDSAIKKHEKALYYLNINKDKLNSEGLKKLKRLLFYVLKRVNQSLTVEVHFDESVTIEYSLIQ